ncbi:M20/M25/M40 family metallo-hydrolase [Saccharothrix violaceirubra]|uniref:LysW-gamma-L-lysine carboxypeptidase n=1 Tax=Saccharothrix violaceirubra TaxID=413306 RepID=A0A7W7WXQ4_9PSEU|nr:M20/M25/M40 family metallo-hydrolase [Saccharothrix violaceirubra]MBB4967382.1 LysW-gamma-L-lysine carboxypeptidase [Saccharothrix violaceirubra]
MKIGSASLRHDTVFDELAGIPLRGARVLLVAGGAAGIVEHYESIGRDIRFLRLRNGDDVRYCPPEEMAHIVEAYRRVTLPRVRQALATRGIIAYTAPAADDALVCGTANPPIRAVSDGRVTVVRDHRAGVVSGVDVERILSLLEAFDVVCLSPPVSDSAGGSALNVDADVLAAELANALDADHLRLVTGTPGLLADPTDPTSRQEHVLPGEGGQYASGRMKQKVRAAEIALTGAADVAITGPHVLAPASGTRFWRATPPADDLNLLTRTVELSSVSADERELADYLVDWCTEHGVDSGIDQAGNFVAVRGSGARRLLLLGHLDTVAHRWPARWSNDEVLHGRGTVDAKGSLAAFLETLVEADVPAGTQLRVVGAVEEEMTSAGAFFVRDNYPADAVIVGEPSGAGALTISYRGLLKIRLTVRTPVGHTAGHGVVTAADQLVDVVARLRAAIAEYSPEAMMAVLGLDARNGGDVQLGEAVFDVRVPHTTDVHALAALVERVAEPVRTTVLRATPGHATPRTSPLVRAFSPAFRAAGVTPRYLAKKGSSDMNTLATTWRDVPMVAYGPGDASLDHTPQEHITAAEFRLSRKVLSAAVTHWLTRTDHPTTTPA